MRRIPFNRGWETRPHASFFLEMVGAAAPWRQVTLPHDAALGRDRDPAARSTTGYVPGGAYEYRTTLHAPEEYRDRRVLLEFEGVYRTAMVYVNGALAGHWATGYTGFAVVLDDHLLFGADNEIRVVCRTHEDSRWYSGAGIHRPVHLVVGALTHIALDGVRVTTIEVDDEFAVVEVATTVEHAGRGLATLELVTEIRDGDGGVVTTATSPVTVLPGEPAVVRQRVLLPEPALWSPDSPSLYTAVGLPAERGHRGGRRHGDLRRPHPRAGPRARAADQRRDRSSCAARASTTTTACSVRRRSAAPRSAVSSCSRRPGSTRCAAPTTR